MDWCWNSNILTTWCDELTHLKRPWCWERLKAGGEGDDRGWDGWTALPNWWTWVWASSGSWWWTGKPGMLQSVGSQRVRHDWASELKPTFRKIKPYFGSSQLFNKNLRFPHEFLKFWKGKRWILKKKIIPTPYSPPIPIKGWLKSHFPFEMGKNYSGSQHLHTIPYSSLASQQCWLTQLYTFINKDKPAH